MNKRTFIFAASIVAILFIGAGAYFLFFSSSQTGSGVSIGGFPLASSTGPGGSEGGFALLGQEEGASGAAAVARLSQIATGPVVPSMLAFDSAASSTPSASQAVVRYIDRPSGNVYSYDVTSGTNTRISNKTIPGVVEASWLPDGSRAYLRYLSNENGAPTIATYALSANGTDGFYLPQDITALAANSTGVLALVSGANGSIATRATADYRNPKTAFQTPLGEIQVAFAGKDSYLVYTKPSATQNGYAFLVHNGAFEQVAGPYKGLSTRISPDGTKALVSYRSTQGAMQLALLDLSTYATTALPVATLADKCVWAADSSSAYCGIPDSPPAAMYPDDWYQGAAAFSDRVWRIDAKNRYVQLVLDPASAGKGAFDVTALALDPAEQVLSFVNKQDGSLWAYRLTP